MNGHLLSINDLTRESALDILDTAEELRKISEGPVKKLPTLRGDRKSTRLNSSHPRLSRMPSSA